MSGDHLNLMIRGMLAATTAVILVLLARVAVRKAFGARTAYAFWMLVPSAALASFLPLRSVEVSALPRASATISTSAANTVVESISGQTLPVSHFVSLSSLLLAIWAAGVLASLIFMVVRNCRFVAGLGLRRRGLKGRLWLATCDDVGPALIGVLRPRIVVPHDFVKRYDRRERALVLAHERAHLVAGDAQVNGVAAFLLCLGWFNPVFHVARRYLRIDQELACDERVMRHCASARRAYANTMLKTQFFKGPTLLAIHWPGRGQSFLSRRISLLARPALSRRRRALGVMLCGVGALAIAVCTSAAQPPRVIAVHSSDGSQHKVSRHWFDPALCQRLDFLHCREAANSVGDSPYRNEAARRGMQLVLALQNGDIEQARRQIRAGADVNFFIPGDGTPLVIAAQKREYAITKLLLEEGADANRFAPGDGAPLIIASTQGDSAIVELLVAHHADVNAHRAGEETALISAARNNQTSVARLLLEHGADANLAVDASTWIGVKRRSPLSEATREHHLEMIRLLREYGAT